MATFTDVDTVEIRSAAQSIQQNIDAMRKLGSALNDRVISELVTCWQGEAKDLFVQQFTSFNALFARLIEDYEALNDDLESADGAYTQANEQITGCIKTLQ